ncbi:MAG: OFA family MFS transporter, partial [Gammaproteobacteria bacterium]|nr:OFA family MFS transporter [Gammaproteobacteria bacterium]
MPRWIVAVACTALQLCLGTVYAWSFFQTMLVRDHGWTFTDTAWAFSIAIFSLGTSAAWAGAALPKLGPRKLALAGSAMFCGGYVIASIALRLDILWLFYLGYGVIGGAGIGLGYVTPVATVAKWYPDRKGLATGIVVMGFGVGAFLLSKVLAPLLVTQTQTAQGGDLPQVFLYLGLVFACVLFPASLVLRDPPADSAAGAAAAATEAEPDVPLGACLSSREFAVMW